MTLILGLANARHVVQLSDRRLSWNGRPVTEQSNKATVLVCENARLVFGFSGIAQIETYLVDHRLADILSGYPGAKCDIASIIDWLKERLTTEFASNSALLSLPRVHRALSVMGTGFATWRDRIGYVNVLITNFQDADTRRDSTEPWDIFKAWWWKPKADVPNATHVQRIGAWQATTLDDLTRLRAAVEREGPPEKLVGAGVSYIREVADRPASGGTVGKSISSVVIRRDDPVVTAQFHSGEVVNSIAGVNQVVILPGKSVAFRDINIRRVTASGDTRFVPEVGRNKPCPCRSGKKYKNCHGHT